MKKLYVIVAAIIFMCIPYPCIAQDQWGFQAEDFELTFGGSGSSDDDLENTTLSFEGSIGYFITDVVALGLRQGGSYADSPSSDDAWSGSSRGYLDLYLDAERFQPLIGVNLGCLYGDEVTDSLIAGPEAGVKIFILPSTFLYALSEYNYRFEDSDNGKEAFDKGRFVYVLGMGFTW